MLIPEVIAALGEGEEEEEDHWTSLLWGLEAAAAPVAPVGSPAVTLAALGWALASPPRGRKIITIIPPSLPLEWRRDCN